MAKKKLNAEGKKVLEQLREEDSQYQPGEMTQMMVNISEIQTMLRLTNIILLFFIFMCGYLFWMLYKNSNDIKNAIDLNNNILEIGAAILVIFGLSYSIATQSPVKWFRKKFL